MKASIRLLPMLIILITLVTQSASTRVLGQTEWKTIKTFTGTYNKDTEDFTVPTNYWRIVYTIAAQNEPYAVFAAYIYPSGKNTGYITHVDFNKSGTDTSYVRATPGAFWISVLAANLKSWTIQVQTQ